MKVNKPTYRWPGRLMKISFYLFTSILFSGILLLGVLFLIGPPPMTTEQNTIIYSNDGSVIGVEKGIENRYWIEMDDFSDKVIAATLLIEDQHFYEHYGFDFKRIAGAVLKNIGTFSLSEGASTVTQQLARNLYLTHEKTWKRKLKEAFYTVRLEMHYTKDEILEGYLNTIYYGHGAYGIEAASQFFFNKSQAELSYAEAAMLAGVPKGPSYYSPLNDEDNANSRKELILYLLWENDMISDEQYRSAQEEKLVYYGKQPAAANEKARHFQDAVLEEASQLLELPKEAIRSGGYTIHTTLDFELQSQLEKIIPDTIPQTSELETAVISMEPHSGAILTLSGGRNYEESMFNRAISAKRMPGSSFKPFLYYAALENGYTPLTKLQSKPTEFMLEDGETYKPGNFNHYYAYEPITLAQAVALSDNVYAVRTHLHLGPETLVKTAERFGISSSLPAVASLALGTASVSLEEMTAGYSMLANGGKEITAYTIEKIVDRNQKVIYERKEPKPKQVLDKKTAFILTHLLSGVFNSKLDGYMPVTGTSIAPQLSRLYAGKSGTTKADNWMIGYSPSLVTGVWTGYDDHRTIHAVAEANYAKEIWAKLMETAHKGKREEQFPAPEGVIGLPIDVDTGLRATPHCGQSVVMYFVKGTEPDEYCQTNETAVQNEESGIFKKWFQLLFD